MLLKILLSCIFVIVFLTVMPHSHAVTIFLRPDSSSIQGGGAGTFADVNEDTRNDSNFVQSKPIKGPQSGLITFSLSGGVDPFIDIDHVIRYTFKDDGQSPNSPYLVVRLMQGTTTIASWTEPSPLPTTFTQKDYLVLPEQIHQISNYNDLAVEFEAVCDNSICPDNVKETVSVSWVEFQYETTTTKRDHPPPTITGIGFYNITKTETNDTENLNSGGIPHDPFSYSKQAIKTDLENYGKYKKSGALFVPDKQPIPTFTGQVNQPIQLQIRLQGVFASTQIEHLSLISGNQKIRSEFTSMNFEIIADKGKKPIVIDPNKILKNVNASYSLEDGNLWINLDLMFQKPLKKSDITLQSWDEQRIPVYLNLPNVWEISDLSTIPMQKEITPRAVIRIAGNASLSHCNVDDSCFEPSKIQIPKGGLVTWINDDVDLHTVVSGDPKSGPDGRFNFAMIPGKIYEKKFESFGTYKYYCSIHPWNTGIITVSGNIPVEPNMKYPFLNVVSKPLWKSIQNDQRIVLKNHDLAVVIFGSIPEIKKPVPIDIVIQKPDKSIEKLSITTKQDGQYYTTAALSKKWQKGTFKITLVYGDQEMANLSFTVSDRPTLKIIDNLTK